MVLILGEFFYWGEILHTWIQGGGADVNGTLGDSSGARMAPEKHHFWASGASRHITLESAL